MLTKKPRGDRQLSPPISPSTTAVTVTPTDLAFAVDNAASHVPVASDGRGSGGGSNAESVDATPSTVAGGVPTAKLDEHTPNNSSANKNERNPPPAKIGRTSQLPPHDSLRRLTEGELLQRLFSARTPFFWPLFLAYTQLRGLNYVVLRHQDRDIYNEDRKAVPPLGASATPARRAAAWARLDACPRHAGDSDTDSGEEEQEQEEHSSATGAVDTLNGTANAVQLLSAEGGGGGGGGGMGCSTILPGQTTPVRGASHETMQPRRRRRATRPLHHPRRNAIRCVHNSLWLFSSRACSWPGRKLPPVAVVLLCCLCCVKEAPMTCPWQVQMPSPAYFF